MRILVTGGTGYVGTALRKRLKDLGHTVRLLVRKGSIDQTGDFDQYEVYEGNVLETQSLLKATEGVDAVYNLVGIRREVPQQGTTYEALHTMAAYNILEACRINKVPRIVQMSGLGTREDAASRYHKTKWEAEELIRKSNMRWTIFRPSVIFDETDNFHPELGDLVQRPIVPLINGGKELLQPVSLENVIDAMARCVTMPETQGEVYEVGGPDRISFGEIFDAVTAQLHAFPNIVNVSGFVMKPAVKMLQRFRSFPLTYDELLMLMEDNVCDTEHFTSTFGIKLDSYREALPAMVKRLEYAKVV